jgi:hypothetical protein
MLPAQKNAQPLKTKNSPQSEVLPKPLQRTSEKKQTSAKPILITSLSLAVLTAGAWYYFKDGSFGGTNGTPPIILADAAPTKMRPDNAGKTNVPHEDKLFYDKLNNSENSTDTTAVTMLAKAETPLEPGEAVSNSTPEKVFEAVDAVKIVEVKPLQPMQNNDVVEIEDNNAAEEKTLMIVENVSKGMSTGMGVEADVKHEFSAPKETKKALEQAKKELAVAKERARVLTLAKIRENAGGTEVTEVAGKIIKAPQVVDTNVEAEEIEEVIISQVQNPTMIAALDNKIVTDNLDKTTDDVPISDEVVSETQPQNLSSVADVYKVQIASVESASSAAKEWKRISHAYKSVFGTNKTDIERVDLGAKGVRYRIYVPGFSSKAEASAFCSRVKEGTGGKVGCIPVKN